MRRLPIRLALGVVLLALTLSACRTQAPDEERSPGEALLARSVRFHDPEDVFDRRRIPLTWKSVRPDGRVASDLSVELLPYGDISVQGRRGEVDFVYVAEGDHVRVWVDGQEELDEETRQRHALDRDDGFFWRNYLGFLAGLPMNLAHGEVAIAPEVQRVQVGGAPVDAVRVSFPPWVGTDVWTLYFDPTDARLVGCRFDRADPEKDGETILFEGLVSVAGLRLPRQRRWTMNADGRYLGMDELGDGAASATEE